MGESRPRKLSLSPVQREVLWMLEEAGEEDLPEIISTMRVKFSDLPYEELLGNVRDAVEGMAQHGLVYLYPASEAEHTTFVVLTAAGRDCLRK